MASYTALFDANILYPAPMRDIFMQLAVTDLFKAKWTNQIHDEWINALLRNNPELSQEKLERTRDLINQSNRDCLVENYEGLIEGLKLPDLDDRHILAAAIVGRADVIVTQNLKDFPVETLSLYGIEAQHPDEFLCNHLSLAPGLFCASIKTVRQRLQNPHYTTAEYLKILINQGLVATATELEQFETAL